MDDGHMYLIYKGNLIEALCFIYNIFKKKVHIDGQCTSHTMNILYLIFMENEYINLTLMDNAPHIG